MESNKLKLLSMTVALSLTLWGSSPTGTGADAQSPAPAAAPQQAEAAKPTPYPAPPPPDIVLPAGTRLRIRLDSTVSTAASRPGDHFMGTLASPAVANGVTVLPTGTTVGGLVVDSRPSGRIKGHAVLTLRLNTVSVDGRMLRVSTGPDTRASAGHKKRYFAWIGGGSGAGMLIGAAAGGPIGLAIGAGSGAAAGFAGEVITGRRQVKLPAETELTFHLSRPLTVPQRG